MIIKCFHISPYAALALDFFIDLQTFQTFSAVAGIVISCPPNASITAFITVGGAAIAPASPHPLTPKGFDVACVQV